MTTLTPEVWAQVRAAYEAGETPVEDICVQYGISSTTLRSRMRRWGWTRRRPPVPRDGPAASVIPGHGVLAASPESITPALRRMDSGPAAVAASRNDEEMAVALPHPPRPFSLPLKRSTLPLQGRVKARGQRQLFPPPTSARSCRVPWRGCCRRSRRSSRGSPPAPVRAKWSRPAARCRR